MKPFFHFPFSVLRSPFSVLIILTVTCCTHCLAQPGGSPVESRTENAAMLRQTISRPITHLKVLQNSAVNLIYDTANYIDVWYNPKQGNPLDDNFIAIKGMTLVVDDPEGDAVYYVHLKQDELQTVYRDTKAEINYIFDTTATIRTKTKNDSNNNVYNSFITTSNDMGISKALEDAGRELAAAKEELLRSLGQLADTLALVQSLEDTSESFDYSDFFDAPIEVVEETDEKEEAKRKDKLDYKYTQYYFEDRFGAALLWGFNNWGSEWHNGLSSLEGAYNLKTSFSSWQLEFQYAVAMTRHFDLSLGIGYESDIYRFTTPLVSADANGRFQDVITTLPYQNYDDFLQDNQLFASTQLNDWSSRLVTRYIGMPVTLGLRFDDFKISLTALPALALNTRHTGLKHGLKTDGIKYCDNEDISSFITPYKLDLRLEIRYSVFGIFAQVATTSLFSDNSTEVFPFKIGFEIKK